MTKIEMTNEEAIKRLKEARTTIQPYRYVDEAIDYAIKLLEQQPKSGKWIDIDATHSQCDKCLAVFEIVSANGEANFCPHCGADMRGEDNGE